MSEVFIIDKPPLYILYIIYVWMTAQWTDFTWWNIQFLRAKADVFTALDLSNQELNQLIDSLIPHRDSKVA